MTQSNFQGKAQPSQPCSFKIQPPGSHCQLDLSLGFVTVLAFTSSPSKFGPPHWLGHVSKREPSRENQKMCSSSPALISVMRGLISSIQHLKKCMRQLFFLFSPFGIIGSSLTCKEINIVTLVMSTNRRRETANNCD